MFKVNNQVYIREDELEISAVRSSGPGGQHVNKVSTAIQLRFDINSSSLPLRYKQKLLALNDQRINKEGVLIIKSQAHRSRSRNLAEAYNRLQEVIRLAIRTTKPRIKAAPNSRSVAKRLENKKRRGELKKLRSRIKQEMI